MNLIAWLAIKFVVRQLANFSICIRVGVQKNLRGSAEELAWENRVFEHVAMGKRFGNLLPLKL